MSKAPRRKRAPAETQEAPAFTGRVTAGHGRHFVVTLPSGERILAHRRGKKGDVTVGDVVGCSAPVSGVAAIESIEERRTLLYRSDEWRVKTLAANADLAVIVYAARPTFNPWFIWKALLAAHQAGIPALVIRNKTDLADGAEAAAAQAALLRSIGEDVIELSATTDPEGARKLLLEKLTGRTALLVGQSGMGKSTILNLLVPEAQAETREYSEALDLGKQTTTAAQWHAAPLWQGAVIDTPGFQEFGLAHLSLSDILRAMPDIAKHVEGCRFFNCRHLHEPGCNVKAALERGDIDPARYAFYEAVAKDADPIPR
ncbi:ribosome small subunit-dependent GTPase A [Sutterella sp.]|uniref:ribosome small subunit-dependent GTPase A n=1 Tax=Sutterella sp. TaxID=1981025 RepID=UPI0026DFCE3E|nr:ribosome small subunit-dependent GTPase A [Sutterella sp.]MDO5531580.1 ribosome small subunit-dependent GTPase A [Sutterella sp.]